MPVSENLERKLTSLQNWIVAGLCFIVMFAVSMTGVMLWQANSINGQSKQLEDVAIQTHDALCALKFDLVVRHKAGVEFLQEHPTGISGIPAATLEQSIQNEAATLRALRVLDCTP